MKTFHDLALLAAILAAAILCQNQAVADDFSWGHPSPQGNTIFGLAFADAQEGWAVGGSGFVLHTQNGGESWAMQHGPLEIAPDLYDVVVTPSGTLIACGAGNALYRSVDDGATWSAPAHPAATDLRDLCLVPGGAISAAGDNGVVLISGNDGLTWNEVGPGTGTIQHHVWRTPLEGYVVGRGVSHRTTNGGNSWTEFIPTEFLGYNEVYFTTALDGYVLEDFGYWNTTNGGASWTEHFLPVEPLYRFRTLVLTPAHWLLAVHGEGGELWETADAGQNWTLRQRGGAVGFPCIVQAPGGRIFYGSDTGDIFRTDDFGHTVENATLNFGQNAPAAQIKAIYTRPDGVLFAANQPTSGENPTWVRSSDGGHTWAVPPQTPGLYWALVGGFFDNQRGMVGYNEQIRATLDGGGTWQAGSLPASYRVADVAMPAADRYFAAALRTGSGGGVFKSSDGGLTWSAVGGGLPAGGTAGFSAVDFPTPLTGFAAGDPSVQQPRLYRTLDGGTTWQLLSTTGLNDAIRSMMWFDTQRGLASLGFNDPGIHRTEDGGLHWTPITDDFNVAFVRRSVTEAGAFTSSTDFLLRTTDTGLTWVEMHAPLSGPFPGMTDYLTAAAPTANGWVLGGSRNRLLVAQSASPADAPSLPPPSIAGALGRLEAEPNPLHGSTILHLENPTPGPMRLEIFDARGSRVNTLVDANLPAGSRAVSWNGKDDQGRTLPAGVYFARSRTPFETRSVKLTLVR